MPFRDTRIADHDLRRTTVAPDEVAIGFDLKLLAGKWTGNKPDRSIVPERVAIGGDCDRARQVDGHTLIARENIRSRCGWRRWRWGRMRMHWRRFRSWWRW